MSVTIRDAGPGDSARVAGLLEQLGYPTSPEAAAVRIGRLAASRDDRLLVAEVNGDVAGLAGLHVSLSLEHDRSAGKLSAIVVDERHRGRGVGEALMAAIEAEARARDCCLLFLTTAERRKDAHAFYRSVGFEETGRRFVKPLD